MSIFRRGQNAPDLSDAGLEQAEQTQAVAEAEAVPEKESADPAAETEQARQAETPEATPDAEGASDSCSLPDPEREQRWQEAARAVADHWPQMKEDLPALLGRMKQISERYGDPELWQRSPAGIMREAAVELYGMPPRPDAGALSQAVRAAHEQGRQAAADRRLTLAGLAPPQVSRSAPPPLTEEEKILRDMRQARKGRLF